MEAIVYPCQYVIDKNQPCKYKQEWRDGGCSGNKSYVQHGMSNNYRDHLMEVQTGFNGRPYGGGAPTMSFPNGLAYQDNPFFFPPLNTEGRLLLKRRARSTGMQNQGCW